MDTEPFLLSNNRTTTFTRIAPYLSAALFVSVLFSFVCAMLVSAQHSSSELDAIVETQRQVLNTTYTIVNFMRAICNHTAEYEQYCTLL